MKKDIEVESNKIIKHKAVLVNEVLQWLSPKPGGVYLDATFGGGGHTRAILEKEPTCKVIALDWDAQTLEENGFPLQEEFGDRLQLVWGNFSLLYKILKKEKIGQLDGILADFGPSQIQIASRSGFSFSVDTPLDMRMSPAHQPITAADLIASATEEKLRQIFWQLGEERSAKRIAHTIIEERKKKPIVSTKQLADIVVKIIPYDRTKKTHPATKVFQAIRIYINRELENIESLLAVSLKAIRPDGRLVCISFHSLEDRLVKQFFTNKEQLGEMEILTPKAIIATKEEISNNPSARSAKLRAARIKGEKNKKGKI